MSSSINTYQQENIKALIWQSIARLDKFQQIKLLEFINSMAMDAKQDENILLKYAGCMPKNELESMKTAINNCEKIDNESFLAGANH